MSRSALGAIEYDAHRASVVRLQALSADETDEVLPSQNEGPESLLLRREELGYLRDAVAELPERLRTVVEHYFFQQHKMADIARDLGVTESRISQLRSVALTMLREGMHAVDPTEARPAPPARPAPRANTEAYRAAVVSRSTLAGRLAATTVLGESRYAAHAAHRQLLSRRPRLGRAARARPSDRADIRRRPTAARRVLGRLCRQDPGRLAQPSSRAVPTASVEEGGRCSRPTVRCSMRCRPAGSTRSLLQEAADEAERSRRSIRDVLINDSVVTEMELTEASADAHGINSVDLVGYPLDAAAMAKIPLSLVIRHRVLGIGFSGDALIVAVSDPPTSSPSTTSAPRPA